MTHDRRRWPRLTGFVVGTVGVLVGVLGVVARTVAVGWQPMVVLAAFFPLAAAVGLVAAVLCALVHWWPGAVVGLAVVVWTVVVQTPLFVGATAHGGPSLTVLQANLMIGGADATTLVARVRSAGVDVLTVDELTPEALQRLTAAGLDTLLPHRLVVPFPGGAGTGIWSRNGLGSPEKIEDFSFELLSATVTPDGGSPVRLVAVHLLPRGPTRHTPGRARSGGCGAGSPTPRRPRSSPAATSTPPSTSHSSGRCCGAGSTTPPSGADPGTGPRTRPTSTSQRSSPSTTSWSAAPTSRVPPRSDSGAPTTAVCSCG